MGKASKIKIEQCALEAVRTMAAESLDPERYDTLIETLDILAVNRNHWEPQDAPFNSFGVSRSHVERVINSKSWRDHSEWKPDNQ